MLVWPIAISACETWTLNANDRRRLKVFEIFCQRPKLKISWTKRKANEAILTRADVNRTFIWLVERRKLYCFGDFIRSAGHSKAIQPGRVEWKKSETEYYGDKQMASNYGLGKLYHPNPSQYQSLSSSCGHLNPN